MLILSVWAVASLWLLYAWPFGFDEFEHLHAAWLLSQGSTPYADFVEEHNPLLWVVLQPLLTIWPQDASIIYPARVIIYVALLLSGLVLAGIARELLDRRAALWTAAIWLSSIPVLVYGFQARPDTLMMLMLLVSVWLLVRRGGAWPGAAPLAASGAAWGVAFLFLQKAMLFLPVLGILLLARRDGGWAGIGRCAAWWGAGAAAPLVLGAAWLFSRGALGAWWMWGFLFSRTAPAPPPGSRTLGYSLGFYPLVDVATETSTAATLLAILGATRLFLAWRGHEGRSAEPPTPYRNVRLAAALGLGGSAVLLASLAIIRRPSPWYLIPVLATLSILAADGVRWCLDLARRYRPGADLPAAVLIALLVVAQPLVWLSSWPGFLDENPLHMRRDAFVRCVAGEDDVVFQGGEEFNLFRRDASAFWYDPFEQSRRAATLGLPTMRPFEELVRERRPAVISLHSYVEDQYGEFLEGAGYEYAEGLRLYYLSAAARSGCVSD